jgi:hypothetical protein
LRAAGWWLIAHWQTTCLRALEGLLHLFRENLFLIGKNLPLILFHPRLVSENLIEFGLIRFNLFLVSLDLFLIRLNLFLIGEYLIVVCHDNYSGV